MVFELIRTRSGTETLPRLHAENANAALTAEVCSVYVPTGDIAFVCVSHIMGTTTMVQEIEIKR